MDPARPKPDDTIDNKVALGNNDAAAEVVSGIERSHWNNPGRRLPTQFALGNGIWRSYNSSCRGELRPVRRPCAGEFG